MVSDCKPSWSAIWLHTAGSYPSVVSMRRRTSVSGDFSDRNRRTDVRSSSCSSLKAKFMLAVYQNSASADQRPPCVWDAGGMGQLEKIWSDSRAEVHQIVVGPMDNNVYIVRCTRSGDAMLIDAANEHEALLEICRNLGVTQVVETHGHWDHIQAVPAVREAGISVAVTEADAAMLPSYDEILVDDAVLEVGRLRLKTV